MVIDSWVLVGEGWEFVRWLWLTVKATNNGGSNGERLWVLASFVVVIGGVERWQWLGPGRLWLKSRMEVTTGGYSSRRWWRL